MVSEPETGSEKNYLEPKLQSPSIERKMSVVNAPNLQELNIPVNGSKPGEKRQKKISRFLVSPVVDKQTEETSVAAGSATNVGDVSNSSQNSVPLAMEMTGNLNTEVQDLSGDRKFSGILNSDVSNTVLSLQTC